MEKQIKNKKFKEQTLPLLITLSVGVLMGFGILALLRPFDQDPLASVIPLAISFAVFPSLHTLIHEAGHLVAGKISGYKFISFRIYSFMWIVEDGKLKFKRLSVPGTAGQCLMLPPDTNDGKCPVFLYNMGGVIANLTISCIFGVIYAFFNDFRVPAMIFGIGTMLGIIFAMLNGIPLISSGISNDGYNALALSRNPSALSAFRTQLLVVSQQMMGKRLSEMPEEWFAMPTPEELGNSLSATIAYLRYARFIDLCMLDEANALAMELLMTDNALIGLHRNILICERIFYELVVNRSRNAAGELMTPEIQKFMKTMRNSPDTIRIQLAIALLFEKDKKKAGKLEKKFEKYMKIYPFKSDIIYEYELVEMLKEVSEQ